MEWVNALSKYEDAAHSRSLKFSADTEECADKAFWILMKIPAPTISALVCKGRIMLSEYGETGEVRTDLVEFMIRDLIRLSVSPLY
jgi:hypothetical protein